MSTDHTPKPKFCPKCRCPLHPKEDRVNKVLLYACGNCREHQELADNYCVSRKVYNDVVAKEPKKVFEDTVTYRGDQTVPPGFQLDELKIEEEQNKKLEDVHNEKDKSPVVEHEEADQEIGEYYYRMTFCPHDRSVLWLKDDSETVVCRMCGRYEEPAEKIHVIEEDPRTVFPAKEAHLDDPAISPHTRRALLEKLDKLDLEEDVHTESPEVEDKK